MNAHPPALAGEDEALSPAIVVVGLQICHQVAVHKDLVRLVVRRLAFQLPLQVTRSHTLEDTLPHLRAWRCSLCIGGMLCGKIMNGKHGHRCISSQHGVAV